MLNDKEAEIKLLMAEKQKKEAELASILKKLRKLIQTK